MTSRINTVNQSTASKWLSSWDPRFLSVAKDNNGDLLSENNGFLDERGQISGAKACHHTLSRHKRQRPKFSAIFPEPFPYKPHR